MKAILLSLTLVLGPTSADDRSDHRNQDCEESEHCSDDDFSPSFDNSPIIICLPESTCRFDDAGAR